MSNPVETAMRQVQQIADERDALRERLASFGEVIDRLADECESRRQRAERAEADADRLAAVLRNFCMCAKYAPGVECTHHEAHTKAKRVKP